MNFSYPQPLTTTDNLSLYRPTHFIMTQPLHCILEEVCESTHIRLMHSAGSAITGKASEWSLREKCPYFPAFGLNTYQKDFTRKISPKHPCFYNPPSLKLRTGE